MEQLVLVQLETTGKFTARSLALPDVRAEGDSAESAVEQVRQDLTKILTGSRIVRVDVPSAKSNPWAELAGWAANDPLYDLYLEELRRAREAEDKP